MLSGSVSHVGNIIRKPLHFPSTGNVHEKVLSGMIDTHEKSLLQSIEHFLCSLHLPAVSASTDWGHLGTSLTSSSSSGVTEKRHPPEAQQYLDGLNGFLNHLKDARRQVGGTQCEGG